MKRIYSFLIPSAMYLRRKRQRLPFKSVSTFAPMSFDVCLCNALACPHPQVLGNLQDMLNRPGMAAKGRFYTDFGVDLTK